MDTRVTHLNFTPIVVSGNGTTVIRAPFGNNTPSISQGYGSYSYSNWSQTKGAWHAVTGVWSYSTLKSPAGSNTTWSLGWYYFDLVVPINLSKGGVHHFAASFRLEFNETWAFSLPHGCVAANGSSVNTYCHGFSESDLEMLVDLGGGTFGNLYNYDNGWSFGSSSSTPMNLSGSIAGDTNGSSSGSAQAGPGITYVEVTILIQSYTVLGAFGNLASGFMLAKNRVNVGTHGNFVRVTGIQVT